MNKMFPENEGINILWKEYVCCYSYCQGTSEVSLREQDPTVLLNKLT